MVLNIYYRKLCEILKIIMSIFRKKIKLIIELIKIYLCEFILINIGNFVIVNNDFLLVSEVMYFLIV